MVHSPIKYFNISNQIVSGAPVINDAKLLEIISCYPFLYNPKVPAYENPDYSEWAWKRINAVFNQIYAKNPTAAFSVGDLINRWKVLESHLKKAKINDIPANMLRTINKIRIQLNDNAESYTRVSETPAQMCLSQHMQRIVDLPTNSRLALERDIINLLLSEELSAKRSTYNSVLEKVINDDTEEFLRDISYQKVLDLAYSVKYKANELENSVMSNNTSNNCQKAANSPPLLNTNQENNRRIKKCRVRVKRLNMEDHIPLSNIKIR